MTDATTLKERFAAAGQEQVFAYWDELSEGQRTALCEQAEQIDLAEVDELYRTLVAGGGEAAVDYSTAEPAPYVPLPRHGGDAQEWAQMVDIGEDALRAGRVAAFTVAGGQGTRLGFDGPKGTFPVTPVRQATLFQLFAEKVRAARERYAAAIPWFIMTSEINHEATELFFRENNFFGLPGDDVVFFRQGLMPAISPEGKILLEDKGKIAMSPDGHGGSLRALVRSGACKRMAESGIDFISYFQVDNPLVKCLDPAFIGYHLNSGSEMSSKMLPKAYPKEKVGNFAVMDDKTCVIEYSDLPDELAEKRTADGDLAFNGGSIAIHILDRQFVERIGGDNTDVKLPFHRANKKVAVYDPGEGKPVKPDKPNGVKFEMFVFDALPFARHPIIIETAREDDFSPVKNAEGVDSPASARADQLREAGRWLRNAGATIATDHTGLPEVAVEITPLFADRQAVFLEKWKALEPEPELKDGTIIS
ncbi:MAG: UTP--glucose-1-phosphate uridylyltransferase [Opitutales bacterium]